MDIQTFNRATLYLKPLLALYGTKFFSNLVRAKIKCIYAGDLNKGIEGIYVVTEEVPQDHPYIFETYFSFNLRKYVSIIKILAKYEGILEHFWKGEYDKMYGDELPVTPVVNNRVNPVFHVLRNTSIGKAMHKQHLLEQGFVDEKYFPDFDSYLPKQSDFPPSKEKNLLNYVKPVRTDSEMA